MYLKNYLDDASNYRQLGKVYSAKHLNSLIEQLLYVAEKTAVHSTTWKMGIVKNMLMRFSDKVVYFAIHTHKAVQEPAWFHLRTCSIASFLDYNFH